MQMQNPHCLSGCGSAVALDLFGSSRSLLRLGARAASPAGRLQRCLQRRLATALGTSCTAPVLAIAVGFTFTQPG
jgi:hypothetical protein